MKKLRTLFAAALLTLPILSISASQVPVGPLSGGATLQPTAPVASCCWVVFLGRWMCIPC